MCVTEGGGQTTSKNRNKEREARVRELGYGRGREAIRDRKEKLGRVVT